MMLKRFFVLAYSILSVFLSGCSFAQSNNKSDSNEVKNNESTVQNIEFENNVNASESDDGIQSGGVISKASTILYENGKNRMKNLYIAANALEGTVLAEGEEFSFNKIVGRRTALKGYKKSTVFIENKKVQEIGGGICQISTTIFHAALDAGMDITERHDHQLDVLYAEKGNDAAVAYGTQDFKFVNTKPYPVIIKVGVTTEEIIVELIRV